MDETGQVIGVATLVIAEGQNLNFAIPVEKVPADLVQLPSPKPLVTSGLPAATPTPTIDANDAVAHYNRGNAYTDQGKFDEAIGNFNEAIQLDPNYAAAYNDRGVVYCQQRKFDKAISDFSNAIRLDPNLCRCPLQSWARLFPTR
jgi:tetratricopeptide (TPR) repeat protein